MYVSFNMYVVVLHARFDVGTNVDFKVEIGVTVDDG